MWRASGNPMAEGFADGGFARQVGAPQMQKEDDLALLF